MYTGAMLPRAIIRNGCLKKFNCSFIRGRRPQTSGGDSPTGFVQFMATLPKEGTFVFRYVFVDGIDTTESDPLRKLLVVDPSDGESKTLYEAMVDRYAFEKDDNGRPLTPSTTQLNSNFKCVFS